MNYISSADQQALGERYRQTALILALFGGTVLVYLLIARLVPRPELADPSFGRLAYAAALIGGLTVVLLRRLLLSGVNLQRAARRGVGAVLGALSRTAIICGAIAEAVAVLGLIAYLRTGDTEYSWRLGVIGLLLILYSFPRRGEWERAVAASESAEPAPPLIARKHP